MTKQIPNPIHAQFIRNGYEYHPYGDAFQCEGETVMNCWAYKGGYENANGSGDHTTWPVTSIQAAQA